MTPHASNRRLSVRFFRDHPARAVPLKALRITACEALDCCGSKDSGPIHIIFCTNHAIRSLNARYRRKNKPTDVLSFVYGEPQLLGEVYISLDRAAVQARDYGTSLRDELRRLLVHGILHLHGHDHHKPAERKRMEALERRILSATQTP